MNTASLRSWVRSSCGSTDPPSLSHRSMERAQKTREPVSPLLTGNVTRQPPEPGKHTGTDGITGRTRLVGAVLGLPRIVDERLMSALCFVESKLWTRPGSAVHRSAAGWSEGSRRSERERRLAHGIASTSEVQSVPCVSPLCVTVSTQKLAGELLRLD